MDSVDLLVIHPGAAHGIYGKLGDELVAVEPPLWARLIAGYIRDHGHSVAIIDAEAQKASPEEVAGWVADYNPKLVCLAVYGHQPSASTQQMIGASATAKAIKGSSDHGPIIMVGGHVAALPKRTLQEEEIDFACTGEGLVTVEALLSAIDNPAAVEFGTIPGLVWRDGWGETVVNPSASLIEDMSQLHGDVWDLLPMNLYRAHNWQCLDGSEREPYASVYTSLGCPYKCSFCCINAPFDSNRYRMRDPEDVVNEIVQLYASYGVATFKIVDEMFILNEKHYTAICEGLINSGISDRLNIWAYARIDTVKPATLKMLRKAGFRWLALGIESGSKFVRDGAQKALKNNDISHVVRAIQAAGINVIGNYIFGLPDDDQVSMQATLDLALELNTEFANFYSAMAYPGSRLYTDALRTGAVLPETWRGYSQHNDDCRPMDTQYVSGRGVLAFRDAAFQTYFASPAYQAMILQKFGLQAVRQIQKMTEYKLTRKLLLDQPAVA